MIAPDLMTPPTIFLAAMPKTGSTHIRKALQRLTKLPVGNVCPTAGPADAEQCVDLSYASALFSLGGHIYRHHVRATNHNVAILATYRIRPVVLMRNVLDCLVSLREAMMNRAVDKFTPMFDYPKEWWTWDDPEQYEWLCYNVLPWFLSFYKSWSRTDLPHLTIWYEDFFQDQVAGVNEILQFCGHPDVTIDEEALAKKDGRFNVGVSGRGRKTLGDLHLLGLVEAQMRAWGPELYGDMARELCRGEDDA